MYSRPEYTNAMHREVSTEPLNALKLRKKYFISRKKNTGALETYQRMNAAR